MFYSELAGGAGNANPTPFWLRANQFGTIPLSAPFGLTKIGGEIQLGKKRQYSRWVFQGEVVATFGKTSHLLLPVGNIAYQSKWLDIYAGRRKEVFGLCDTLTGSGSYIWSGNALPLPKIHIGTRGFVPLNFTKGFIAVHATLAHGWFGKGQFANDYYLHQKSLFLRFGKLSHAVQLYTGVVHFAQWGGTAPLLVGLNRTGPNGELPQSLQDFWYVFTARGSPPSSTISLYDSVNRIGNHLGSISLGLSYRRKTSDWLFFYQRPIETDALIGKNFPDGQYGLSWHNRSNLRKNSFSVRHFTVEYLTTLRQNLRLDSRWGYFADGYFNNSQYMDGWTYQNRVIGTPFFTLRTDTRPEWFDVPGTYKDKAYQQVNGNSIKTLCIDVQGIYTIYHSFRFKVAPTLYYIYYNNDGTYEQVLSQFSGYAEYSRRFRAHPKTSIVLAAAYDKGEWLPATAAGFIALRHTIGNITTR